MQTSTVGRVQSSAPHSVPSIATCVPQPLAGSHVAARHIAVSEGHTRGRCVQPNVGSHRSVVQASPSSQALTVPLQTPARQTPPVMHADWHGAPSALAFITHCPLASSNVASLHAVGTQSGTAMPVPMTGIIRSPTVSVPPVCVTWVAVKPTVTCSDSPRVSVRESGVAVNGAVMVTSTVSGAPP